MGSKYPPIAYSLFASPSFWVGFGQSLDVGNTMFEYNQSLSPKQADSLALRGDWRAVGNDFRAVLEEIDESENL
jgi:hypothetical protein